MKRNINQSEVETTPSWHSKRRGKVGCGLLIPLFLGLIFGIVGFCVMFFAGWPVLQKAKASVDWPTTKGVVVSAEVIRNRSDDGVTYRPEVLFEYTVDGEKYQQNHIRYDGDVSTSSITYSNKMVRKYKPGTEVVVHYDPAEPTEAVLEPGTTWSSYFLIGFGAIFFLVGAAMFLGTGGYLLFGLLLAGGAAGGVIGKPPSTSSSQGSFEDENPYANPDSWEDDNSWEDDSRDDGFENV